MRPSTMVNLSLMSFAKGARQLVVQDALLCVCVCECVCVCVCVCVRVSVCECACVCV